MTSISTQAGCTAIVFLLGTVLSTSVSAHSGGLNSEGCHNDRKNGGITAMARLRQKPRRCLRTRWALQEPFATARPRERQGLRRSVSETPAMAHTWTGTATGSGVNKLRSDTN